jgi:hypothetical protein
VDLVEIKVASVARLASADKTKVVLGKKKEDTAVLVDGRTASVGAREASVKVGAISVKEVRVALVDKTKVRKVVSAAALKACSPNCQDTACSQNPGSYKTPNFLLFASQNQGKNWLTIK